MSNSYSDIQTRDRTDTATAAENLLKERVEQRLYQENLEAFREEYTEMPLHEKAMENK